MSVLDCLKTYIGLSKEDCVCIGENKPEGADESLSGKFILNTEISIPVELPKSVEDCNKSDIWEILELCREQGAEAFLTDFVLATNNQKYSKAQNEFTGFLAKSDWTTTLTVTKALCGVVYMPVIWRGVVMKLRGLELYFRTAGDYDVDIYLSTDLKAGDTTPFISLTVSNPDGLPSVYAEFPEEQIIPLMDDNREPVFLYAVVTRDDRNPLNIYLKCGTCGVSEPWQRYLSGLGLTVDTPSELLTAGGSKSYAYGVRLQATITCGVDWLCNSWDFQNDPWARTMADALVLYSNRRLINFFLNAKKINKYTLYEREALVDRYKVIEKMLTDRMTWLTSNLPEIANHCFKCNKTMWVGDAEM